jgi:hypothetical protein
MLNVFETGDASFRLSDQHDQDVGWIRGAALGFDGFATEADALAAAVAGSAALTEYLERLTGSGSVGARAAGAARGRVHVVHDGAYEWVSRGKVPLARLYRPERDATERQRRRTFAVEFVLPSYVKAGAAVSASQVLHRAITRGTAAETQAGATASGAAAREDTVPIGSDSIALR